jgi:hypothetical protein
VFFVPLLHFSDYSFLFRHLVHRDDQHLLAHAMASNFTVRTCCYVCTYVRQTSKRYLIRLPLKVTIKSD